VFGQHGNDGSICRALLIVTCTYTIQHAVQSGLAIDGSAVWNDMACIM